MFPRNEPAPGGTPEARRIGSSDPGYPTRSIPFPPCASKAEDRAQTDYTRKAYSMFPIDWLDRPSTIELTDEFERGVELFWRIVSLAKKANAGGRLLVGEEPVTPGYLARIHPTSDRPTWERFLEFCRGLGLVTIDENRVWSLARNSDFNRPPSKEPDRQAEQKQKQRESRPKESEETPNFVRTESEGVHTEDKISQAKFQEDNFHETKPPEASHSGGGAVERGSILWPPVAKLTVQEAARELAPRLARIHQTFHDRAAPKAMAGELPGKLEKLLADLVDATPRDAALAVLAGAQQLLREHQAGKAENIRSAWQVACTRGAEHLPRIVKARMGEEGRVAAGLDWSGPPRGVIL